MQSVIEKYEKILQKPMPEPFKGYIDELIEALKSSGTIKQTRKSGRALVDFSEQEKSE